MPWLLAHKGGIEDTLGGLSRSMEPGAGTGGSTRDFLIVLADAADLATAQ
jgi:hypothetical protein